MQALEFYASRLHKESVEDCRRAKKIMGRFLMEQRYGQRLTPEQLSRRSGLTTRTINQLEMGKGTMDWGTIARVALCLGKPLSEFLWYGE